MRFPLEDSHVRHFIMQRSIALKDGVANQFSVASSKASSQVRMASRQQDTQRVPRLLNLRSL